MDKKQIYAVMETDAIKSLTAFNAAAADLLNATFIIVSSKISRLLQSIAASRPLCDYLAGETRGYNFVDEFRARQLRDEKGRAYIEVPTEPNEQMKFAFCMLYAIDTGKLNFEKMLHTFYYDSDANTELRLFCNDVVRPFADNLNAAFTPHGSVSADPGRAQGEMRTNDTHAPAIRESTSPVVRESTSPATTQSNLPSEGEQAITYAETLEDATCAAIDECMNDVIGFIAHDNAISTTEREELLLVCDAFSAAIKNKELTLVRLTYVAFKNTVKASSVFKGLESKFNELKDYVSKLGIDVNV